jgi:integrase
MATIKFQLRSQKNPSNIYIRLIVNRQTDVRCKTGYSIDPVKWSTETNLPKKGGDIDQKNLKTELQDLANHIEKQLNKAVSKSIDITGYWLQQQIDTYQGKKKKTDADRLINYVQHYIDSLPNKEYPNGKIGATHRTVQKYITLKNKLTDFEKYKKKRFFIKDVGMAFRNDLVKYFFEVDRLSRNSTGRYVRYLKTVCRDAKNNGIETHPQLEQINGFTDKVTKVFLTIDELETIEDTTFDREALENAKDWLIIGCYIGQRVSDLLTLTDENIKVRNGLELIELTQKKTGKEVAIPLHRKVKSILDKRNGEFPDKISDQKFNKHIKDVCKLAEINELIKGGKMVTDEKTKITRKQFGIYPKHELITSHVCRRSFASNFYGEIPTSLLINITAHSTEKQFLEYIGKSANDYAIQLAEYWNKEGLKAKKEPQMQVIKQAK